MEIQTERTDGNWTVEKEEKRMQPDGVSSFLKIVSDKPRYDMENGPTTYLICRFPMFSEANAEFVVTAVNFHDRLVEALEKYKETLNTCVQATTDISVSLTDPKYWKAQYETAATILKELEG